MKLFDKSKLVGQVQDKLSSLESKITDGDPAAFLGNTLKNLGERKKGSKSQVEIPPVEEVVDVVEKVVKSVPAKPVRQKSSGTDGGNEMVVDSISGMSDLLMNVRQDVSPAASHALQSQLQMLKFVQSPTLSGMVIDNMIMNLYSSLKIAEENEKEGLRDAFSSMIQSLVFFLEAQLRYEENKNDHEAINLMENAGQFLSNSIMGVISLGTGALGAAKNVIVKNVFGGGNEKSTGDFLAHVISLVGKKRQLKEKYKEFDQMLMKLYRTFDQYFPLIGKSILISSLLDRYKDQVVERFQTEKFSALNTRLQQFIADNMIDRVSGLYESESLNSSNIKDMISNVFSFKAKKKGQYSFDDLQNMLASYKSSIESYGIEVEKVNSEIKSLKQEERKLSFIKVHRKNEIKEELEHLAEEKDALAESIETCKLRVTKIHQIQKEFAPLVKEVEDFEASLTQIVDKYTLSADEITF